MADWVDLGSDVMKDARSRRGLSYESLARLIPVSSKTWERWEKRGQVPRFHLPKVADVLALEVEVDAPRQSVRVMERSAAESGEERLFLIVERLASLEAEQRGLAAGQQELAGLVQDLLTELQARPKPRRAQS